VAAVGNIEHEQVRALVGAAFEALPTSGTPVANDPPSVVPYVVVRNKELEQSHVCLGTNSYQQDHASRFASYALNTVLGGSMSSRLFQNVREKRGLAYAVASSLHAYRDAGALTIYAGCANESVGELIDVVVGEIRHLKSDPISEVELRRTKDHLKGSTMLGLESTSNRLFNIARQEMYFDRQYSLDETLQSIEAVTRDDVRRVTDELFAPAGLAATVLGAVDGLEIPRERLHLG
jgi:predicted Zn-dependent peptidase